ncbi:MAG: hypothetical protein KJ730_02720 [Proteobacteria bacterium]|jgi:hypothetical protein|nr:hypothetical protein [Pseudomonadota bacterium]
MSRNRKNNEHPFPSGHTGNTAKNNRRRKQSGLNLPGRAHVLRPSGLALQLRDERIEQ